MVDSPLAKRIRPLWLASYPRSGNTFLRIILESLFHLPTFSLYNVEGQNFPDPSADALEQAPVLPHNWQEHVSNDPGGQLSLIKTHEGPRDASPAIYVVRDGRAAIDSYFHYHEKFAFERPSLTEVIAGACQFGRWSAHYLAWSPRTRPNTLVLRYEDLVGRPNDLLPQLAAFLKLDPVEGRLPTFEELKQRYPAFFRRGQNQDFLSRWTPGQMALFNALHGEVMEQLGYALTPAPALDAGTVSELADAAGRLHDSYLEHLGKLGTTWAACQQLSEEATKLKAINTHLTAKEEELKFLLDRRWVKLGLALGLVRPCENKVEQEPASKCGAKHPPATQTA